METSLAPFCILQRWSSGDTDGIKESKLWDTEFCPDNLNLGRLTLCSATVSFMYKFLTINFDHMLALTLWDIELGR